MCVQQNTNTTNTTYTNTNTNIDTKEDHRRLNILCSSFDLSG